MCVATVPAVLVMWVGATRVLDHWHHKGDVVAAWIIGLFFATVSVVFFSGHAVTVDTSLTSYLKISDDAEISNSSSDNIMM